MMGKPLYTLETLTTAGLLAGMLLIGRALPAFTDVSAATACPAEQCVTLPAKDFSHSDVGSRGPGFGFAEQGAIRVVTPAL